MTDPTAATGSTPPPARWPLAVALGLVVLVALAALTWQAGALRRPESAQEAPVDLAAAKALYVANCASCHGDAGRGDGPEAVGLDPPPADFALHMGGHHHTDEQAAAWIRDGYPGSAMPA